MNLAGLLAPILWALLLRCPVPLALAHDPGLSSALINVQPGKVEVVLAFAKRDAELLENSIVANPMPPPETGAQLKPDRLAKLVQDEFRLEFDHEPATIERLSTRTDDQQNTSVSWTVLLGAFSSLTIESKLLGRLPRGHRQYLAVQIGYAKPFAERLLNEQENAVEIEMPAAAAPTTAAGSAGCFLKMGVKHILTGYDHLLFLFGLLIVTRRFAPALRIITCFTIAHSITLALATLGRFPAPPRLVEPLIAASIIYVGIENLLRGTEPKGRWLLTFCFGLIHGCGFASALREVGVGVGGRGIAVPLICFNGGVEVGQLLVAALALPVIWRLRTSAEFSKRFVPVSSAATVLLGSYWLVQRLWVSGV